MKGFECQLCGGRIRNGRCEQCGWVNQTESHYLLNKSSCDTKPLTHVHNEKTYGSWEKVPDKKVSGKIAPDKRVKARSVDRPKVQYGGRRMQAGNSKKKGRGVSLVVILAVLFGLVPALFEAGKDVVGSFLQSTGTSQTAESQNDYLYEFVTRELSDSGEDWSMDVTPGIYVVGVDIPEGMYDLEAVSGSGSFYLKDEENSIFYTEYLTAAPNDDDIANGAGEIRLYTGAQVQVKDGLTLNFTAENAQTDQLESAPNPLTESVGLKKGEVKIAGKDFEAGVYDVAVKDGWTSFVYKIPMEGNEEELLYNYVWLDSDSDGAGASVFKNIKLDEDTQISSDSADVELTPSSRICP